MKTRDTGIRCPTCGGASLPTKYTRHAGTVTMRVRQCKRCAERVRTRETVVR